MSAATTKGIQSYNLLKPRSSSTFTPLIFSVILYASNGKHPLSYIDALFNSISATTVCGLATVDMSSLTPWQQFLLFFQMSIGNPVSKSGYPRVLASRNSHDSLVSIPNLSSHSIPRLRISNDLHLYSMPGERTRAVWIQFPLVLSYNSTQCPKPQTRSYHDNAIGRYFMVHGLFPPSTFQEKIQCRHQH